MKVCQTCQKIMANNTKFCSTCGKSNLIDLPFTDILCLYVKKNKKIVISIISLIIVLHIVFSIFISIFNIVRINKVKEQLAGNEFYYNDGGIYNSLTFDDNSNCVWIIDYQVFDSFDKKEETKYDIIFKDGMVFLDVSYLTLEIQYDKYGQIDCLYDIKEKEKYERK